MPVFTRPDAEIHYEVHGAGYPLLLFAPGGLRSQLEYWRHSPSNPDAPPPWMNPMVDLAGRFTVGGRDIFSVLVEQNAKTCYRPPTNSTHPTEGPMGTRRSLRFVAWLFTLVAGVGIGTAIGQQSPPVDTKGVDAQVVSTVDLAPDMSGYQLRLRKLTIEPGGVAGIHSHKDRPAFAYFLEGTLTEGREGGYVKEYKAGDVLTEARTVTHWAENKTSSKVVLIGVDIIKNP